MNRTIKIFLIIFLGITLPIYILSHVMDGTWILIGFLAGILLCICGIGYLIRKIWPGSTVGKMVDGFYLGLRGSFGIFMV